MLKKTISSALLGVFLMAAGSMGQMVFASEVLPANTAVTVKAIRTIGQDSSKTGDRVTFTVAGDVSKNGKILIKANTPAYGTVTSIEDYKRVGRPGTMTVGDIYTNAVDGSTVKLTDLVEVPESRMGRSIALSVIIIPLFLLMRGAKAELAPEAQRTLHTIHSVNVNI